MPNLYGLAFSLGDTFQRINNFQRRFDFQKKDNFFDY